MITTTLVPPNPLTDSQQDYNTKAQQFMEDLVSVSDEINQTVGDMTDIAATASDSAAAAASSASTASGHASTATTKASEASTSANTAAASAATALNAPGTSATSTTSLAIGTGSKSLTIQTGKSLVVGMSVVIASTAAPSTNRMYGNITSYTSGTGALVVDVLTTSGSGTYADWTISLSAGNPTEIATRGEGPEDSPKHSDLGDLAYMDSSGVPALTVGVHKSTVSGVASENAIGNAGASKTVTWATRSKQAITLDQNTTLTFDFTGCPVGNYQLKITQDGTGGRTITWSTGTPGTNKWLGVVGAPSLNSAANGVSFANIYWDGTNSYGALGRVNAL